MESHCDSPAYEALVICGVFMEVASNVQGIFCKHCKARRFWSEGLELDYIIENAVKDRN